MMFDKNLSAIHAYLCADGYVIKNPSSQKHKYYHIGLRNTNKVLLKDFQIKFYNYFNIKPYIVKDGRCRIQSKDIFNKLTKRYSYYSKEWKLPDLSKNNLKYWLRAFFDCESWVECQKGKSRTIRLECVNLSGLKQIQKALRRFYIDSSIQKRSYRHIWRLNICGLDDLQSFKNNIGFLHHRKKLLLTKSINSYLIT